MPTHRPAGPTWTGDSNVCSRHALSAGGQVHSPRLLGGHCAPAGRAPPAVPAPAAPAAPPAPRPTAAAPAVGAPIAVPPLGGRGRLGSGGRSGVPQPPVQDELEQRQVHVQQLLRQCRAACKQCRVEVGDGKRHEQAKQAWPSTSTEAGQQRMQRLETGLMWPSAAADAAAEPVQRGAAPHRARASARAASGSGRRPRSSARARPGRGGRGSAPPRARPRASCPGAPPARPPAGTRPAGPPGTSVGYAPCCARSPGRCELHMRAHVTATPTSNCMYA